MAGIAEDNAAYAKACGDYRAVVVAANAEGEKGKISPGTQEKHDAAQKTFEQASKVFRANMKQHGQAMDGREPTPEERTVMTGFTTVLMQCNELALSAETMKYQFTVHPEMAEQVKQELAKRQQKAKGEEMNKHPDRSAPAQAK